jgi:hypothetical protein
MPKFTILLVSMKNNLKKFSLLILLERELIKPEDGFTL